MSGSTSQFVDEDHPFHTNRFFARKCGSRNTVLSEFVASNSVAVALTKPAAPLSFINRSIRRRVPIGSTVKLFIVGGGLYFGSASSKETGARRVTSFAPVY